MGSRPGSVSEDTDSARWSPGVSARSLLLRLHLLPQGPCGQYGVWVSFFPCHTGPPISLAVRGAPLPTSRHTSLVLVAVSTGDPSVWHSSLPNFIPCQGHHWDAQKTLTGAWESFCLLGKLGCCGQGRVDFQASSIGTPGRVAAAWWGLGLGEWVVL